MSGIWTLLKKDIRRRARSPVGLLILITIPLAISLIFGMVFSPSGDQAIPRFTLLVVDNDDSFVSNFIKSAFGQGPLADMVDLQEVSPEEGGKMIDAGKATALLEIPEGFSGNLLDGIPDSLRLVKNPAEQFMPEVAENITESIALLLDYGSRILADPIREIRDSPDEKNFPDEEEWMRVGKLFYNKFEKVGKYVLPPVIKLETEVIDRETEEESNINYFALFLPGMALMSLLFIGEIAFRDLAVENKGGQLKRIFVSPTGSFAILLGKFLFAFTLVFVSFLVMVLSGIVFFGISFEKPLLFLAGGVLASLACSGIMGCIYSFIGEEKKGEAVTSIIIIIMCMMGGSFVPIQAMPDFMKSMARFTVNYWSIDMLQGALWSGFTDGNPVIDALVLASIAVSTTLLSVILLRRRLVKGIVS